MSSDAARPRPDDWQSAADRFPDRLDALLAKHWPPGRGRIVGPAQGIGGADLNALLADADGVARLVRRFQAAQGEADARATASVWSQWYLATTWPVLIGAALIFEEIPPLTPDAVALALDAECRPVGLELRRPARPAAPAATLHTIVFEQSAPLLQAVTRTGRLPQRIVWSNAAAVLTWTVTQLEQRLEPERVGRTVEIGRAHV